MSWKKENYITSVFSILLFVAVLYFKSYYNNGSNKIRYLYILLAFLCLVTNMLGIIFNGINMKDTILHSSKTEVIFMILFTILYIIMGLFSIIIFTFN